MLHKTRGIVFRFTRYGETSIIVNVFTEAFGLQTYIANGVRSKSSRNKIALYQPLTLLDLVVYHRPQANINRIKEIKCLYAYKTLATDVRKSAIAMFLNEVLNKVVKDESHAQEIADFLIASFIALDTQIAQFENFHLIFLVQLSRFLGFGAHHVDEVLGPRLANPLVEEIIRRLLVADYAEVIAMTNVQRREILELIISFFADHIETMGEIRSLQILREVMG
ncbi:MAG TPA: DNA repair protein RecO [Ohtaekwangia sp.]|nr:DNA repair protein RecO [Ohtaekwangia sp.]